MRERFIWHMKLICFRCYCSVCWKLWKKAMYDHRIYNFPKRIAFQSAKMNYSNMTVLCRCDALLSQGHKIHQTKHVSTETSYRFKNGRKTMRNCSCLFLQFNVSQIPKNRLPSSCFLSPGGKKKKNKTYKHSKLAKAMVLGGISQTSHSYFVPYLSDSVDWDTQPPPIQMTLSSAQMTSIYKLHISLLLHTSLLIQWNGKKKHLWRLSHLACLKGGWITLWKYLVFFTIDGPHND